MKFVTETVQSPTGQVYMKTTYASSFNVTLSETKGTVVTRTTPFDEYKSLLGVSSKEKMSWIHCPKGFIPGSEDSGYLDGYLSEDGWSAVWREKAAVRQLIHTSGHYRIPFPDLLFFVKMVKGIAQSKMVWAIDENDTLYQYPFGNVSTRGDICMGNICLEDKSIKGFSEEFFLGKTNNDYFHPRDHVKVSYPQDELLRRLDKKKEFPKRWLIKRDVTLRDVLKKAKPE